MAEEERLYIALVSDPVRRDTIVFSVIATGQDKVRRAILDYYIAQGWTEYPEAIHVRIAQHMKRGAVQLIGHAYEEYQALAAQVEGLSGKLLNLADSANIAERDDLYAYVAQFPIGERMIKARRRTK